MAGISGTQKNLGIALAIIVVVLGLGGGAMVFPSSSNQGYKPTQPIPFSHKIHAGDNKIACTYCHAAAETSRHASIPSMNVCMNCHSVVKTESPYIQQVKKAYDEGRAIEWVRVHELPDFVHFPHKRHVAKGISCETCHGNVREMAEVEQVESLNMGWCMGCHRGETTPKSVRAQITPSATLPPGHVAPTNCSTCHN